MNQHRAHLPRLLSLVVAVVLVAGACGSDSDPVEVGDPGDDTPVADPSPAAPTPTPDGPLGAGPYPIAELTIDHTDGTTSSTYTISCLGDTATVIDGPPSVVDQEACAALADDEVVARLVDGPDPDRMCTAEYGGPDEATIVGTIDDVAVDTAVDRRDGCGISEWNGLLSALLPPPTEGR